MYTHFKQNMDIICTSHFKRMFPYFVPISVSLSRTSDTQLAMTYKFSQLSFVQTRV